MESRATESSAPHGTEVSRENSEEDGGGRSEGAGGNSNVEKIRQAGWCKVADGLKGEKIDSESNRGPVKMSWYRGNAIK